MLHRVDCAASRCRVSPAARPRFAPVQRRCTVRVRAGDEAASLPLVQAYQVKELYQEKGYTFLDIRTPQENAEGAKKWWVNLPIAFETPDGPKFNGRFRAQFQQRFPNKLSRVIIACDDGGDRTELAGDVLSELGYTAVKALEGGTDAYFEMEPLTDADKAPKWRLTGQTSGVRYAYDDGESDDSA